MDGHGTRLVVGTSGRLQHVLLAAALGFRVPSRLSVAGGYTLP